MTAEEMLPSRVRDHRLKTGITRTREFERKGIACFAANVGLKRGHDCLYCSSGAVLRTHPAFRELGENPFHHGYSIVDPSTPERVARDAARELPPSTATCPPRMPVEHCKSNIQSSTSNPQWPSKAAATVSMVLLGH
jgi:hypothetical protein